MNLIDATVLMLGCAVLLVLLTRRFAVPYPSVLVLGGLIVALIPGAPHLTIQPAAALSIFLPAVLFQESSRMSLRALRQSALSVGLAGPVVILGSCAAVAALMVLLFPGIPPAVAVVIGAVVAPADATASRAVLARLKVPRGVIAVLAGEGLVNDALAIVIYKVAIAAVLGSFVSVGEAAGAVALLILGGAAYGVGVGWVGARLLRASDDAVIYGAISLTLAYVAYVTADALGLSGAIATVAAGVTCSLGQRETAAELRLTTTVMWQIVTFILNALGFLLIGAQVPVVLADLDYYSPAELAGYGAALCLTILIARLLLLMLVTGIETLVRRPGARRRQAWRENVVVGWSGMRGLVTLAAALGLPLTPEGSVFPYRDLTLFFAYAAILSTLFGQGMTLAPIVRALKLEEDAGDSQRRLAGRQAAAAALLAVELDADIDEVLLEVVQDRWLKVARVLRDASDRLDLRTEADLSRIADRLKILIGQGRIEVQGDPDEWRHAEVRRG